MNRSDPRERITWHPAINYDACIGDQACIEFCANEVFEWDNEERHPIVQNPLNCVVGCDSCAQICPVQAISFPDKGQLKKQLRELRAQARNTAAVASSN